MCDIGDDLWRTARAKLGPRYNFFNKLAAITTFLLFPSWEDLLLTLAFAKPPPLRPGLLPRPDAALWAIERVTNPLPIDSKPK